MAKFRNATELSFAGLIALGLLAVVLSAAAVLQHRAVIAEPAPTSAIPSGTVEPDDPEPTAPQVPSDTSDPVESAEPATASPTNTATEDPGVESPQPGEQGLTVVVIGDSNSVDGESETWIGQAAEALQWGEVVNLSSPGRGFSAIPRFCDFDPCTNFGGSVTAILAADPDVVITFGGTADGDYDLSDLTTAYFGSLREELPDAHLVAISPVTTADTAAYWMTLHNRTIGEAVEAVDGVFINVGQPGLGDGDSLSADAHTEIADVVIEEMSGV